MDFHALTNNTFYEALKLLQSPNWTAQDFCHYTSLQGLIGILECNELWLSDHRFVNDELEYAYGKHLTISVISEMATSETDNEFVEFLNRLLESFLKPSDIGIYLGSMSFSPDKLDQWKGYGKTSESVCIKFSGDYNLWNIENLHPTYIRQQNIIYEEMQQVDLIKRIIQIYKDNFDDFRNFYYPFLQTLRWLIESQFILFKHKEYASEDELRITIDNLDHVLKIKRPKHRIANGMIIPYITTKYIYTDVNPPYYRLPIKEIVVSPTSKPDLLKSIKVLVANMGYADVQVVESIIRFRG